MSFRPYTDEHKQRLGEFAELFYGCRQAFRDVAEATHWRPAPNSPAAKDIQTLAEHNPSTPIQRP